MRSRVGGGGQDARAVGVAGGGGGGGRATHLTPSPCFRLAYEATSSNAEVLLPTPARLFANTYVSSTGMVPAGGGHATRGREGARAGGSEDAKE